MFALSYGFEVEGVLNKVSNDPIQQYFIIVFQSIFYPGGNRGFQCNAMNQPTKDQVRHNITVNLLDGSFFGARGLLPSSPSSRYLSASLQIPRS
jgi:hypothetical protein